MMAFTHFSQLFLSLLDLCCLLKTSLLVGEFGLSLRAQLVVAAVYGAVYSAWLFWVADVKKAFIYPFIAAFATAPKRVAFAVVVTLFVLAMLVGLNAAKVSLIQDRFLL